jgi:hypothetical protein
VFSSSIDQLSSVDSIGPATAMSVHRLIHGE